METKITPPKTTPYTAVFKNDHFQHFGIHPVTAQVYGDKVEDILDVELTLAENQVKPSPNQKYEVADYWGYFDYEQNKFTMIYPQYFLLSMCFPSGVDVAEEVGRGKAFRLNVKKIEK